MDHVNEALISILLKTSTIQPEEAGALNSWWSSERLDDESLGNFLIRKGVFIAGASRVLGLCRQGYLKIEDASSLLHQEGQERLRRAFEVINRRRSFLSSLGPNVATQGGPGTESVPAAPVVGGGIEGPAIRQPGIGELLGRCLLTDEIRRGASGVVYRALHTDLKLPVAVKVPFVDAAPGELARFESRAQSSSRLAHRNVLRVLDYSDEPIPYLVLEYVEGQPLGYLIRQSGRLQVEQALSIILQVARGLEASATLGIVQGEVNPSNILLSADGTAKLASYGIDPTGSDPYQSPEQARGEPLDHRSDLYALGATFYHAVTGSPPFAGDSADEIVEKCSTEEPIAPELLVPELHPAVSDLILRMMAKSPDDRFEDFPRVISILEAFSRAARDFSERALPVEPPPPQAAPKSPPKRLSLRFGRSRPGISKEY